MKSSPEYDRLCPRCGKHIERPWQVTLRITGPLLITPGSVPEYGKLPTRDYCSQECGAADVADGHDKDEPDVYVPELPDWHVEELVEGIMLRIEAAIARRKGMR